MLKNHKKRQKNSSYKRFWWTFLILVILNLNLILAWDWDNGIDYEKNDKVAVFENAFGIPLISDVLGKAELTSHAKVGVARNIFAGKNVVPIYYDFYDWKEVYNEGLGEVEFIDMNTGKEINKNYKYVYTNYEEYSYSTYKLECQNISANKTIVEVCNSVYDKEVTKSKLGKWKDLDKNDIPEENITIGIMLEIKENEYIDAIWRVAGKKIDKHASWNSSFSEDLIHYYTFDTADRIGDIEPDVRGGDTGIEQSNGSSIGSLVEDGIIGQGLRFTSIATNVSLDNPEFWADKLNMTNPFTISMWVNRTTGGDWGIFGKGYNTPNAAFDLQIQNVAGAFLQVEGDSGNRYEVSSGAISIDNAFHHLVFIYYGVGCVNTVDCVDFYLDGVNDTSKSLDTGSWASPHDDYISEPVYIGGHPFTNNYFAGVIDEFGFWNRTLGNSEVADLYNSGAGLQYVGGGAGDTTNPNVTISSPTNTTYTTAINYSVIAVDDTLMDSCWFSVNGGVSNETLLNTTSNDVYNRTAPAVYSDGSYLMEVFCNDSTDNVNGTETVAFTVDTTYPEVDIVLPTNTTYSTNQTNINITYSEANPDRCWYSLDGGVTNSTSIVCSNNFTDVPSEEGSNTVVVYINDTVSNINSSSSVTYYQDSIYPQISIVTPTNNTNTTDQDYDVNYTYTETNLDSCWYSIDGGVTNTSLICGNNLTNISWGIGTRTVTVYLNDTVNNINDTSVYFEVLLLNERYQTYPNGTIEGSTETFTINFTYSSDVYSNIIGYLTYNNTNYTGTFSGSGNEGMFTSTISIPLVTSNEEVAFNWTIGLINDTYHYTSSNSTTHFISDLGMGSCESYTIPLLNLTQRDEETQDRINGTLYNTTIEVDIEITPIGSSNPIINFTENFSESTNVTVCIASGLNDSKYELNAQIYYDGDSYAPEFYNIQNMTIINSSLPQKINLFDLKDADNQPYEITYKDETFRPVADSLIQIQRKYISEGVFKTVEIPATDVDGQAIGNLVSNDVIYTFIVTKNNETLATFSNYRVTCQNPSLENCEINLNKYSGNIEPEDYTVLDDFSYTLSYNKDTRLVTSIFSVPSGSVETVTLNVTLSDALGNTTACDDTLTSSSGTLTCTIPIALGNGTAIAKITKAGTLIGQALINVSQTSKDLYGNNLIFLGVFLILTIVGVGLSSSPMLTGIFVFIGAIINVSLNIITSNFLGAGATILWLFIIVVLILIKGQKRT